MTMRLITTIDEARRTIQDFSGAPEDFVLPISDQLQDPSGVNMVLIVDAILDKGWEPNGFEQREGFRIYRYKILT
jgi:hypothetical protein